jgi:hypothetical protein
MNTARLVIALSLRGGLAACTSVAGSAARAIRHLCAGHLCIASAILTAMTRTAACYQVNVIIVPWCPSLPMAKFDVR